MSHDERTTLSVDIEVPDHAIRTASKLFEETRKLLIERDTGCYVCGSTTELEAHHHPIEWSLALMIDYSPGSAIRRVFPHFDWAAFDAAGGDPYIFVDDMRVNGLLLCKKHHTGKDEGIHMLPFPLWVAQVYGKEGTEFSKIEIIHHQTNTPIVVKS